MKLVHEEQKLQKVSVDSQKGDMALLGQRRLLKITFIQVEK